MLQRIGFFHFGANHSTPVEALKSALESAPDARDALVVLPEAFNISVPYWDLVGEREFEIGVIGELEKLAGRFGVAFVAGVVIKEDRGPNPPHSAVHLVEATQSTLMCYKVGEDKSAGVNYTACKSNADFENPIKYRGVRVGALVCADADPPRNLDKELTPRLKSVVDKSDIVCIPAHMAKYSFHGGKEGSVLTPPLNDRRVVLANSNPDGVCSFATDAEGEILSSTVCGNRNVVIKFSLH